MGTSDWKRPMVNLSVTWSKAPFIVVPWVVERFDFRVLRQNRRITAGTEDRRDDGRWTLYVCDSLNLFVHETTARASFFMHGNWITSTVCSPTLASDAARSG